jgi:FG-GAP-like repeat
MTTYLYFNGAALDVASEPTPGAPWSSPVACTLNGVVMSGAFSDPQVNVLPNGQFLLAYSTSVPFGIGGEIDTTVSSDGIHFTSAQLAVAAPPNSSTTDPSIVQLPNGTFLMVVAINGPSETTETFYSSTDGRNWTATGASIPNIGGGGLAVMPDGSIRFYVGAPGINGGPGGVSDFISHDNGQTWIGEPGLCLTFAGSVSLPSVWQAAPGLYDMVFQTLIDPTQPPLPNNDELVLATSTDGRNFTVTQTGFFKQVSSADGITPLVQSPQPLASTADFNGDGDSDILWRNSDAAPAIWLMNGTSVSSMVALPQPPSSWHIVGTADFNGDGKADLLWLNSDNTPSIWEMNGTSIISAIALPAPPLSWHLVGTADFNGDGKSDLLWLNSDNTPSIWEMNGTSIITAVALPAPPPSWRLIGTADFNGDGKSDLLWLNSDNTPSIWEMNGTSIITAVALPAPPPSWRLIGTADFNGDGKSDILWQNSDGTLSIWEMNGTSIISAVGLAGPGPGWQLLGTGDFNGDHKSDLLFVNTSTDAVQTWLMNGTQVLSTQVFGNGPATSSIVGPSNGSSLLSSSSVLSPTDIQYAGTSLQGVAGTLGSTADFGGRGGVGQSPVDGAIAAPLSGLTMLPAAQQSLGLISRAS